MKFEFHDECGHAWAIHFLSDWMPHAVSRLRHVLGGGPVHTVHVVLSDRAGHRRRFPPRIAEAQLLIDNQSDVESVAAENGALTAFQWSSYAHGVATCAALWQSPPDEVPMGEPVIYLDVSTIEELAADLSVPQEAMLARVSVHELAHVYRGHATATERTTHGWLHEGDAQRDAWQVLTSTLTDITWQTVARWGRAAQVRLAAHQPPAYRMFGDGWSDRWDLIERDPLSRVSTWIVKPARKVYILSRLPVIEMPFHAVWRAPGIGDHVWLSDRAMTSGPWVAIRGSKAPSTLHPRDEREIAREREASSSYSRGGGPNLVWLTLRPHDNVAGALSASVSTPSSCFNARQLKDEEHNALVSELTTPLLPLTEQIADVETDGIREANRELVELSKREGLALPPGFPWEVDVFDDWR